MFFSLLIWLIPSLTERKLTKKINTLGIIQAIVWSVGMLVMSGSLHIAGLLGKPIRSAYSTYTGAGQVDTWDKIK
ncbi:cbb3-type cytochrome c oxidase subunit I [Gracilibacillus thailandensis]|uniref:cbb3-type cytochrome c oxidase subunit I n=1 Tax=Gracilibacillus thailandensis TaxID=563735 RepID=UPI002B4B3B89|nr:cbb3-type cytochrome c oxidase subunit I [Gracilibacillus thailandensis]